MSNTRASGAPAKRRGRLRRLSNAALFALVRGAATATGTALVGLASWWLAHHA
jgi:hypothetical protein